MKKIQKNINGITLPPKIMKELKHYYKTKIPRCVRCHKNMVHATDSRTKEISKYLWRPLCKCSKKEYVLCVG